MNKNDLVSAVADAAAAVPVGEKTENNSDIVAH